MRANISPSWRLVSTTPGSLLTFRAPRSISLFWGNDLRWQTFWSGSARSILKFSLPTGSHIYWDMEAPDDLQIKLAFSLRSTTEG